VKIQWKGHSKCACHVPNELLLVRNKVIAALFSQKAPILLKTRFLYRTLLQVRDSYMDYEGREK